MSKTENVELTVLCLIEDGNKILLQNRIKKDWRGYALPGGHEELGESIVEADEFLNENCYNRKFPGCSKRTDKK